MWVLLAFQIERRLPGGDQLSLFVSDLSRIHETLRVPEVGLHPIAQTCLERYPRSGNNSTKQSA